jgi:hypothetical protein
LGDPATRIQVKLFCDDDSDCLPTALGFLDENADGGEGESNQPIYSHMPMQMRRQEGAAKSTKAVADSQIVCLKPGGGIGRFRRASHRHAAVGPRRLRYQ